MDETLKLRCLESARYMLQHRATVRQTASALGLSKSSVHKDLCLRLPQVDAKLARQAAALMAYNKAVRHLRGGEATRRRYQGLHSNSDVL